MYKSSEHGVTPLKAIRAASTGRVRYAKGCEKWSTDESGISEAVKAAQDSDVAVVVVGTWSRGLSSVFSTINHSLTSTRPKRIVGRPKRNNGRTRRRFNVDTLWGHVYARPSNHLHRQANGGCLLFRKTDNRAVDIATRHSSRATVLSLRGGRKRSRLRPVR